MNTETTVNTAKKALPVVAGECSLHPCAHCAPEPGLFTLLRSAVREEAGWVFYDGECAWCRGLARRWAGPLGRSGFRLMPLQTPGTAERLGVSRAELPASMHLLTADGRRFSGADAFVEMARARGWTRPLAWLSRVPGVLPLMRRAYATIAARRHCLGGACRVPGANEVGGAEELEETRNTIRHRFGLLDALPLVLPLVLLPTLAAVLTQDLAPWLFMWSLAVAIFAGCKWLTYAEARAAGVRWSARATWGYLLAWVGMEPREWGLGAARPERVALKAWIAPLARVALGGAMLAWGVPAVLTWSPLAAGWVGMVGCILMLHFGTFDLLALAWRRAGYPVRSLMNAPTRATSVGEFWSTRWNRGFHALALRFLHRPVAARFGRVAAVLAVFAVSGLVHDLVITVPARGGYGGPTLYFLLQALALLFERSTLGGQLRLGAGRRGRAFTLLTVLAPVTWLFPPVFVRNVILPMLQAIGVI